MAQAGTPRWLDCPVKPGNDDVWWLTIDDHETYGRESM
jgi:hypothetical protein